MFKNSLPKEVGLVPRAPPSPCSLTVDESLALELYFSNVFLLKVETLQVPASSDQEVQRSFKHHQAALAGARCIPAQFLW